MSIVAPESGLFPALENTTPSISAQNMDPMFTCDTGLTNLQGAAARVSPTHIVFPGPIINGPATVEFSQFELNHNKSYSLFTAHGAEAKPEGLFIPSRPTTFSPSLIDNALVSSPLSSGPSLPDRPVVVVDFGRSPVDSAVTGTPSCDYFQFVSNGTHQNVVKMRTGFESHSLTQFRHPHPTNVPDNEEWCAQVGGETQNVPVISYRISLSYTNI